MNRFLYFVLLLITTWAVWSCNEQEFVDPVRFNTVRGQVLLNATRQPVGKALVRINPSSRSVETDSLGNFRFDSVTAGKYTLTISRTGLRNEVNTIEVTAEPVAPITVFMTDDRSQNRPPVAPTQPTSTTATDPQPTAVTLRWRSSDPDRDTLTYDVLLFREGSTSPTLTFANVRADSLIVRNLQYSTTYYWQVVVKDGINTVNGSMWSFRTAPFPDLPFLFVRRTDGAFQIFTANTTGEVIQLTRTASNWRPVASPNRQQIAFISNVETDLHLFVMNRDGSNLRRVTSVPINGISPTDLSFCWSPDGTQLLYPSNDRLFAIRTDGAGLRTVAQAAPGRFFAGCDWTAQGGQIVARTIASNQYDNELLLLPADGGNATTLFRSRGRSSNPVFSVDGRNVLFSMDFREFQNEQGRQLDARVLTLDLQSRDTTLVRTEKPAGTNDLEPRYAPNGGRIILTNTDNSGNGPRTVISMDLDGRNRTQLISAAEMPFWR